MKPPDAPFGGGVGASEAAWSGEGPLRPPTLRAPASASADSAAPSARPPELWVRVARGAEVGRFSALRAAPLLVGSASAAGLCVHDRHVSRTHCEFLMRDGECVVRDLGSTNGTFVNGERVLEAVVDFDSRIRVGATELALHRVASAVGENTRSSDSLGEMVGGSLATQRLFAALRSIAGSSLSCLVLGETGTGKELAAKALHQHSARASRPFLVVDCASVGAQFIEDKLFGHERGAFTGATGAVPGVFEEARGGTVFLDEIGELPLSLQAKLLGVLERREVTRIGSHTPIKLDVRLIAATHRNPSEMAKRGSFRQDLLYRISEFTVRIPALRERCDDIPAIAQALLQREPTERTLSEDGAEYLQQLSWPGNVRELRNVVRRAAALASGPVIDRELLESLQEPTAAMQIPDGFEQAAATFTAAPSQPVVRSDTMRAPAPAPATDPPDALPRLAGVDPSGERSLTPEFECSLAEATEAFRTAYVRELRRRFGDDLCGAATHAGVHPKSVSRLFRLYRVYAR